MVWSRGHGWRKQRRQNPPPRAGTGNQPDEPVQAGGRSRNRRVRRRLLRSRYRWRPTTGPPARSWASALRPEDWRLCRGCSPACRRQPGIAFVVVQHRATDRTSVMRSLIEKYTKLRVVGHRGQYEGRAGHDLSRPGRQGRLDHERRLVPDRAPAPHRRPPAHRFVSAHPGPRRGRAGDRHHSCPAPAPTAPWASRRSKPPAAWAWPSRRTRPSTIPCPAAPSRPAWSISFCPSRGWASN